MFGLNIGHYYLGTPVLYAATTLPKHAAAPISVKCVNPMPNLLSGFTATQMLVGDMASGVLLGAGPENVAGLWVYNVSWLPML